MAETTLKSFITDSEIYVDKSLFIQHVIDLKSYLTPITRPRRWGKSLNFDMLKRFLNVEVDQYGDPVINNSNRVLFIGGQAVLGNGSIAHYNRLKIADVEGW
ncbi:MAG: AAA-ATPase-like domain-containing protein [Candidatus Midichloria mitochondrii]|uniref:AAA-ATPase-like domain-containing protein n=1 Tax=Midichloria mitochondrii (strain IricVA) TaxID=696127 RepID=F7XTX3_MIDMI|nr:AAA family ATPase [Candidatus Midichloria mitochondrii]AEI89332.1 hypothetical protein midi_01055 [Candidatus Midichloria mitochondrii IricVA]MDJ1256830.1 AAA family ATPase [Candidatus Midichloria mitochondrii]MDJ1288564.1 AAA family ATPase [Candidatus Midichloria mitochondrii]MDJ1299413.1 AAA family ATPase [Candidatus Midichloria mitochondrii]MDJ1313511.1 AAA family ATPase [Candidatus Midichloria mitochondrii]